MSDEELDRLEKFARAEFATGHGCWLKRDGENIPAMTVAKRDMLWLLDCARSYQRAGR